jgi:glyoxylase-like metal-dependent hydrolase (beta-lactamase superfamily II)
MSFYRKNSGLLFVGDALNGTGGFGLPRRFGCANYKEALRSVEMLARLEFDTCLPGHGEPVMTGARERLRKLLQKAP